MTYAVIYEKSATGYSAYLPDVPGCVAAAKSLQEVERLIQEAVALHVNLLRESGEPVPESVSVAGTVSI
jgi:predicted RNase H-like HicB family nuclease